MHPMYWADLSSSLSSVEGSTIHWLTPSTLPYSYWRLPSCEIQTIQQRSKSISISSCFTRFQLTHTRQNGKQIRTFLDLVVRTRGRISYRIQCLFLDFQLAYIVVRCLAWFQLAHTLERQLQCWSQSDKLTRFLNIREKIYLCKISSGSVIFSESE